MEALWTDDGSPNRLRQNSPLLLSFAAKPLMGTQDGMGFKKPSEAQIQDEFNRASLEQVKGCVVSFPEFRQVEEAGSSTVV
jgi:hypothetical protein